MSIDGNPFLVLLRLGIGHSVAELPKKIDWVNLKALAERQGLSAIVLDGVNLLPVECRPPKTMLLQWIGETLQGYEQRYAQYEEAIASLAAFYNTLGFRMMVLKGLACGLDWPRPEHRPCGDIDIWLFGKQKEADAFLESVEFRVESLESVESSKIKIDRSHHHHTVFQWQGFTVENHYDFVNVHVHRSSRELEKIFKELSQDDNYCVEVLGEKVYLPSPNLHGLFLIRHLVSHFSGANITLRQVLDWAFFVEAHANEIDWDWLERLLTKYHMIDFYRCINAICVEDLGFNKVESLEFRVNSQLGSLEFKKLKERILNDTLSPEFSEETPKHVWERVPFKYRRWKANRWKRELCYEDGQLRTFLGGVWNHLLKPAGI